MVSLQHATAFIVTDNNRQTLTLINEPTSQQSPDWIKLEEHQALVCFTAKFRDFRTACHLINGCQSVKKIIDYISNGLGRISNND